MAIWQSEIKDITPFQEEWIDPFDEGSLLNTEIIAQLFRAYNHLNSEIGVDIPCDTSSRPNNYIYPASTGFDESPTGEDIALVDEESMPYGQYINFTAKMLGDLFTELNGFCNYSKFGSGENAVITSTVGYKESDDRYWQIYDENYDSSSSFKISLQGIIEATDETLFNNLTTPILASSFNLKCKWGNIIKILQQGQELFLKKKSRSYTRRAASISVQYIDGSAEYPFENFSYIQKTGEDTTSTNFGTLSWVFLDTSDGYMFPGNNGHNWCPTQKTQYSNDDIYALPSWEEDIYANNIFGSNEVDANNSGVSFLGSGSIWAISGFDSRASTNHPLTPEMLFFTTYSGATSLGNCGAGVTYETGYIYTYFDRVYLKDVGWYKLGGSRRRYRISISIQGVTSFSSEESFADIKVLPKFTVYPTVAGREIITTNNELSFSSSSQYIDMTVSARLTGDAYLAQPIFPLPTLSSPRTYGASIRCTGFRYFVNGTELLNNFGSPKNSFAVYTSPCGKAYLDYSSLEN